MGTVKEGWVGRFFEDFNVGDVYRSRLGRTITEADNIQFTLLTNNTNQIHFNTHYASRTEFKRPLVNSAMTLSVIAGLGCGGYQRERIRAWLGLHQAAQSGFPGRYALFRVRSHQCARVKVSAGTGRREGPYPRREPGWGDRHRVRAVGDGVEKRSRAAQGAFPRSERRLAAEDEATFQGLRAGNVSLTASITLPKTSAFQCCIGCTSVEGIGTC